MPLGWKLVGVLREPNVRGEYISLFPHRRENILTYHLNAPTHSESQPLFFFADTIRAADRVAWGLRTSAEVALLRVEAREPVRAMELCADEEAEIPAFWAAFWAGEDWPRAKSYKCPPGVYTSPVLLPLSVAWQGRRDGINDAELVDTLRRAMQAIRAAENPGVNVWLPLIRA